MSYRGADDYFGYVAVALLVAFLAVAARVAVEDRREAPELRCEQDDAPSRCVQS